MNLRAVTLRAVARAAGAAIACVLAGCGGVTAPSLPSAGLPLAEQAPAAGLSARRVATIRGYGEAAVVTVPATARAGEPVVVGVTTYGGGCVREDTTVTTVVGVRADVVPYQLVYTPRANEACTLELRINARQVRLTFGTPGPAQVVVTGRVAGPGDSLVRIVRAIDVR